MKFRHRIITVLAILSVVSLSTNLYAAGSGFEILRHGLFLHTYLTGIGPTDPVMQRIIEGKEIKATPGEIVTFQNGKREAWTVYSTDSAGWFNGEYLHSGYGLFTINSPDNRIALLEGNGNDLVYVNGVPRQGNKYSYTDVWPKWSPHFDYSIIPIRLHKGKNQLLFACYRSILKVRLKYIRPEVLFNTKHLTLPDLLAGVPSNYFGGVTLINATDKPLRNAYIKAYNDNGYSAETRVPLIQPMSIRKVAFKLAGPAPSSTGEMAIKLALYDGAPSSSREIASSEISVKVVPPNATHDVTFISSIDGSVQYYAIVPPRGPDNGKKKALFFSLHGAGVIATNMANSYYPKTWGYIVCPTNGGPYGYDWEDWGRLDALQVLHIAESTLNIDPDRVYLTGHSMGGHGTWIIGAQYPDKFGAIGASAGWIDWWSYVFNNKIPTTPMARMLVRSSNPVNTYSLDKNYKQLGVYFIQGSKDNNVPITESLDMRDSLSKFDKDFRFHEQPGVGHWWTLDDEAGADCVDWPPLFDYFARHARSGEMRIKDIDFTTANPGVSAKDYWVTVYSQKKLLDPSRVVLRFNPSRNKFSGTTENVRILSFDLKIADKSKPISVDLDSTSLNNIKVPVDARRLWLENKSGRWAVTERPSPFDKGPMRYGTFKDAFRHDVIFVYGTHGTREENEWAFDKARFDAEFLWYQGGGSIEIVSDREFNPRKDPNRNVILYGNEKTNSAWNEVLNNSPVTVSEGKINFDNEVMKGNDYSCFMIRPRKGSDIASVGIVSGTGLEGMRLTYIVPYLQPWFSLPDIMIMDAGVFARDKAGVTGDSFLGQKNGGWVGIGGTQGVKLAGFFGLDWSVKHGDFVRQ